jgi:hypothetical protein
MMPRQPLFPFVCYHARFSMPMLSPPSVFASFAIVSPFHFIDDAAFERHIDTLIWHTPWLRRFEAPTLPPTDMHIRARAFATPFSPPRRRRRRQLPPPVDSR